MAKKENKTKKKEIDANEEKEEEIEEGKESEEDGGEEKKVLSKQQEREHNKTIKKVLGGMAFLVLVVLVIVLAINSIKTFSYEGVNFETVKFCDVRPCLILYNTQVPISYQGTKYDYNFYLRNDPRKLAETIPFDGNLSLSMNLVIDSEKDFNCDGDVSVAMANWVNLFKISGITPIKDPNATCDSSGRYTFIKLKEGNETRIEQYGPMCYNVYISNCEIIKATERFMVEDLVRINNVMDSKQK
jgi:hypothetical protein